MSLHYLGSNACLEEVGYNKNFLEKEKSENEKESILAMSFLMRITPLISELRFYTYWTLHALF